MNSKLSNLSRQKRRFADLSLEQANSLASMEGDLDWDNFAGIDTTIPEEQKADTALFKFLSDLSGLIPGIILALVLASFARIISSWLGITIMGFEKSPLSPIVLIIIFGIAFRNIIGVPDEYVPGLVFCVRRLLRIGIALLGLRLSMAAIGQIGINSLPVVVISIIGALLIVSGLTRLLHLPPRLGTLIAVGTSICGVSAVVAASVGIKAKEDEVSYAVACVTLYGLCGLVLYPYFAHWIFDGNAHQAGVFLGTAIHDTSQVTGAGLIYAQHYLEPQVLDEATVTKLIRNLFMIVVIPTMALLYQRAQDSEQSSETKPPRWHQMVPLFVVVFVCMAIIRSLGDIGDKPFAVFTQESWDNFLMGAHSVVTWCLTLAMASLGLSTSFSKIKTLGLKPLLVGLVAACSVGLLSYLSIRLLNF